MSRNKRVILIVLDSLGIGASPDAGDFGDSGANTLVHIAEHSGGLTLPMMQKLGLGNIVPVKGVAAVPRPLAAYGRMKEASASKDTIAGHWEMMGLIVDKPFPTFPEGFPKAMLQKFCHLTGISKVLGNKVASGTEIITELGAQHLESGFPILYTSADSVFQIAAHEEIIPPTKLYEICRMARKICDEYRIGRVIARPFVGREGGFTRTANRKDFPLDPGGVTVLTTLKENNFSVTAIGKIEDIFVGQGISRAHHTKSNPHGMECLTNELARTKEGLIFINLIDFDMLYGHRNNAIGYGRALEEFDLMLSRLWPMLENDDLVIITADHGCDPTFPGTDHTREYVPLIVYSKWLSPRPLGTRQSFADIGVSILDLFGLPHAFPGVSFLGSS